MEYEISAQAVTAEGIGLPFAQAVVKVRRTSQSTKPGSTPQTGTRLYVTSLSCAAIKRAGYAKLSRQHWGVENKNHWKRDGLWREDHPRQRNPHTAKVLAALRGALLALIQEPGPGLFARCARDARVGLGIIKSTLQPL